MVLLLVRTMPELKKLVFPYEDIIIDSSVIFLNGPSGSGKPTLSAKISSYILDNLLSANEKDKLTILNFGPKSTDHSELSNYGKLLMTRKIYDEMTFNITEQNHDMDRQVRSCLEFYFNQGLQELDKDIEMLENIMTKGVG